MEVYAVYYNDWGHHIERVYATELEALRYAVGHDIYHVRKWTLGTEWENIHKARANGNEVTDA